jgi:rRNA maturation endonuclease Nob1
MSRYANLAERLRDSVLAGKGETRPELRRAVAARAAELAGQPEAEPAKEVPENLREYVDAISLHAHRITDADIEALRRAGYSEDEIFEISISVALGAGVYRLQRGLAALRGDSGG